MNYSIATFSSPLARRVFILFIISSLIPVLIMAFLSLRQVDSLTSEQITSRLQQDAKFLGMSIYDRLLNIEDKLRFYAAAIDSGRISSVTKNSGQGHIAGLLLLSSGSVVSRIYGDVGQTPSFNEAELNHMRSGRSVLSIINTKALRPAIFISRLINRAEGELSIVSAMIAPSYLWGDPELFKEDISICVFGLRSSYLYCSPNPSSPFLNMIEEEHKFRPALVNEILNSETILTGRWVLFLQARYAQSEWVIVLSQSKTDAFSQLQIFGSNYLLVILLVILIVILSSIYLIRKNMLPLEALMNGIRRISDSRFDARVSVESADEFGEVAVAFNRMSTIIGKQIERLNIQADIDRLILSRPSIDDIIIIALDGVERLVPCNWVGLATMEDVEEHRFQLKARVYGKNHSRIVSSFKLNQEEFHEIFSRDSAFNINKNERLTMELRNISQTICKFWLAVPINTVDGPIALLVLGCDSEPSADDMSQLNELSARIAVAFFNEEWEKKLYNQAHFDHLTKLPNRMLMHDRLQQELNHVARTHEYFAILLLDLDRFKNINDSMGHEYGDKLLTIMAKRLLSCMREEDTVARLGGDEFVILIRSLESSEKALATSSLVAEKITSEVTKPVLLGQHDIRMTTSIGIVICPTDGKEADTLLRNADSAMYHAKDQGRGVFKFYSEHLNTTAQHRLEMESRLRKALDENEFEFYYQPKVDPITGTITSAEALLRWIDKTEGVIYPEKYIHIAEDIGLTIPIGAWGLKSACIQAREWSKLRPEPFSVSVNISAQHFHYGNLVEHVGSALRESGLEPSSLELEITESTAMYSMDNTVAIMNDLRDMGVVITIDDFGTGYSSLTYLTHFPVHALKIDRSFVSQIPHGKKELAIVKSTVALAHNLGLKVIAEGVETNEQLQTLISMECDELQGYLFSRPVPVAQFSKIIAHGKFDLAEIAKK